MTRSGVPIFCSGPNNFGEIVRIMKEIACLLVAFVFTLSSNVIAHDYDEGNIEVAHPWARPTPIASVPGAVYFAIRNKGKWKDELVSVSVPEGFAERVEMHETVNQDGMMRMRKINNTLTIPAGGELKFQPGGSHVMLIGLSKALKLGSKFPAVFNFEKSGPIEVSVWVESTEEQEIDHSSH